ncbi:MAG: penicillin-binding protein activator LpoB [Planctomycetaceae bacterium]
MSRLFLRPTFGLFVLLPCLALLLTTGCRNRQKAHVLATTDRDMVGSHEAGAETWKPLIDEAVARLTHRSINTIDTVSYTRADGLPVRMVCFVGVENLSSEEIGDFREQIYEHIDSQIGQSGAFRMISRRYVEAAMAECRCRPEMLILPEHRLRLQAALQRADQPFDYLLFARITSGTTDSNGDYQRDYTLTLELLDIHSGESLKETALLRKGYHKSLLGKLRHFND